MEETPILERLIRKYDVPAPRYTSYPTVPHWNVKDFNLESWRDAVKRSFDESNEEKGMSLYIHLPFCESLCTYCACNTRITRNHAVEERYIASLLNEWNAYLILFGKRPKVRELHLGGGTPTFFSPENLRHLLTTLLESADIHPAHEFGFEGHPNNTTEVHLEVLHSLGFRRVSYGVQDLDERVQKAINRIQPFENVERVTRLSRDLGYSSVSFDLIFGLPYQTLESITNTIAKVISLRPDRIAFYSYAHVPWLRPGQRGYEDADLPSDVTKRALYERGRRLFEDAGYVEIGMDHFALPHDGLALAMYDGTLHRNFMGYTTTHTDLLIGLGASAISDARYAYAQNEKVVEKYTQLVSDKSLAVYRGHIQSPDDMLRRRAILDIACRGALSDDLLNMIVDEEAILRLTEMELEGLLTLTEKGVFVTDLGRAFVRNICAVLDPHLRTSPTRDVFSKAI
ncbi:MAG TPA: oxygen-independent coproporphyrinogen III oxidase [Cyclobacteriaceae bacterium]|jgi:oxygen-independent coproporphyrinogen-3 oxidase